MATVHSPQDIYARHLVSGRGYPLWTPEPNMSLPDAYRQRGLKIGDVGVVVPEDGSFDVFFNVCLPTTHILHQETGVPKNFTPIQLQDRDITRFPEAEVAGRIISTSSVTRVRNTDSADEDPERRVEPGPLNYQFTLSSREGAVLILPEGAERYYLRNERPFFEAAIQHAVDWYTFAEQQLGRIISHDSLYLITGFHKARSWSLAAYQQGAGIGEASAQFKAVQVGRGNISACYTWESTQAMDWRVGPSDEYYRACIPNQSVFISGFKIAIRDGILGSKWVHVKADIPSVKPHRAEYSGSSWLSTLWEIMVGDDSSSTSNDVRGTSGSLNANNDFLANNGDNGDEDIMVHRFPHVTKPFHPSDIINQHLLREVPSATVAVTHDNQWTTLLEKGLLTTGELPQEDRLIAEVTTNYLITSTYEGAVYLESRPMKVEEGDDAKIGSMSFEPATASFIPPGSGRVSRHPKYYLEDGTVLFLVENVLFRVHKFFFDRESEVFREMFESAGHDDPSRGTDVQSFMLDVTADEFAQFLRVWYDNDYSHRQQDKGNWLTVLRLATRWRFDQVRQLALRELDFLQLPPVERISIYNEQSIKDERFISSCVELCKSPRCLTIEEGIVLGMDTVLKVVQAREIAQLEALDSGYNSPTTGSIGDDALRKIVLKVFFRNDLDPNGAHKNPENASMIPVGGPPAADGTTQTAGQTDSSDMHKPSEPSRERRRPGAAGAKDTQEGGIKEMERKFEKEKGRERKQGRWRESVKETEIGS